jgi:uncharacterized protein (TIGR00730 family)
MSRFRRVCIFCGSSPGRDPEYLEIAREVGTLLASRKIAVVYGGAKVGLMGAVADAALAAGGEVYGVIPMRLMNREVAHDKLTELYVVESMHARKTMMAHLSDAFMALPGGWGTLEEIFEITTWTQLGYHQKPVGMLNAKGYYARIKEFVAHAAQEGFLKPEHQKILHFADTPASLLDTLENAWVPSTPRYMDKT